MVLFAIDGEEATAVDWRIIGEAGFFNGCRVITTMQSKGLWIVDFARHMVRLATQAASLNLKDVPRSERIKFEIESMIHKLKTPDMCRIRVLVFKDNSGLQHHMISVAPEDGLSIQQRQDTGAKLQLISDKAWPRGAQIKTGMLGVRGVQLERAREAGFDDVLWSNGDGEIAETCWGNVFLIGRTGDLVEIATPPEASGIVAGITRLRVIELLHSAKIPVTERLISHDEIPGFDEGFLTSSVSGLIPVTQISKHRLHTLRSHAVFQHVARLYKTWLSVGLANETDDGPEQSEQTSVSKARRDQLC